MQKSTARTGMLTLATAVALTTACTQPHHDRVTIADWCWLHFRHAPGAALLHDDGPRSTNELLAWREWLDATTDAPQDRRAAHRRQRSLLESFATDGVWTRAERHDYERAADTEPTAATLCETVGARIVANDDGTLPLDWQRRFLDPSDPAYSALAHSAAGSM